MKNHKKILGILFIISGVVQLLFIFFISFFLSAVLTWIAYEVDSDTARTIGFISGLVQYIPGIAILFISLPSFIAGIGLLYKQKWALFLALIIGCLNLFSFPIGTALGIYTIWFYLENNKQPQVAN